MSKKRPSFKDFKKRALEQDKFKKEYDQLQPEFDLASQLIVARRKARVSQTDLATRLHTQQPAIARFENGGYTKSSLSRLQEYADALGYHLQIQLIPKDSENHISH